MNYLIFKTNISTKEHERHNSCSLDNHPDIINWTIDREDIDNVLRVKPQKRLNESEVIDLVNSAGYNCEILTW